MPVPLILPSFAAGELSPDLHGRVDLAKYHVGLATCLNWFILAQGGASTRAGTAWVGEIKDSTKQNRQYGFQFSQVQSYVLDFGDMTLRFIMNGGYVLEADKTITAITQANPGIVTSTAHGYSSGDHVWLSSIGGMTELNRRRGTVTVIDADHFSIGIDTTSYGNYTSGGTAARFYTLATPYAVADLPLLKFVQSADTLTITHPSYAPRALTRTSHTSWTLSVKTFAPDQAAPTGFVSDAPGATFNYAITATNDLSGEESVGLFGTSATQTSKLTWTAAAGATYYNIYKNINGIFGLIGRATQPNGFSDSTITVDISATVPTSSNPFASTGNYPGCSQYHDGRQWYARTNNQPQTLWGTQSASYNNMNVSSPLQDSDAITRTLASRQVDEIRFLVSFNVLLIFTSGAVWKGWAGGSADVITATNFNAKPQSYDGIAEVEPIVTADSVLYVTSSGKRVRDVTYNLGSDAYSGPDRSVLSTHLFEGRTIVDRAYAKDPFGIAWFLRDDGILLAFTYLREHDVYAWSRHTTDGVVESIAAVTENNESILYMQVARTVGGQTLRYIERMAERYFASVFEAWCLDCAYEYNGWNTDEDKTLTIYGSSYDQGDTVTLEARGHSPFTSDSVDSQYILRVGQHQALVTVSAYTSGTVVLATLDMAVATEVQNVETDDWALAAMTLGGMWHLEGAEVSVFADGAVQPNATVENGTIDVPQASGRILAGLPFVCDLETLDIEQGQPTMQGRYKAASELVLRLKASRGLQAGPTSDRLTPIKERTSEIMGYPVQLFTGDERVTIDPSWNSNGRIFIRQSNPLPATVVAIIPRMEVGR